MNKKIQIANPFIPELNTFSKYYKKLLHTKIVSNNGPFKKSFTNKLSKFHESKNLCLVSSCTIGLDIALSILPENSEIITTPYSYVATLNSILWKNLKPIFVDVKENTFNINEDKIEEKITKNTSAIVATHVYGFPCNHRKIKKIARKYGLKIIYDAAHCFGIKQDNKFISSFGDLNVLSLHATKVMHSIEGGIIFTKNKKLIKTMRLRSQFGHIGDHYLDIGINAKLSELHSIIGIEVFKEYPKIRLQRKKVFNYFNSGIKNKNLTNPSLPHNLEYNYSYYPLVVKNKNLRNKLIKRLNKYNVFPRAYFSPSLNLLKTNSYYENCPISEKLASSVICLPLHSEVNDGVMKKIVEICNSIK